MARAMLTIAPMPTETNGLTFGITVLKLLAAMNEEKHAPGNEASVSPIMIIGYAVGSLTFSASVIKSPVVGHGVRLNDAGAPCAPTGRSPRFPRSAGSPR